MDLTAVVVLGVLVVVATTSVAPKIGVAGPLLLVVVGIGVGALPFVPDVQVPPNLMLELVLPPLLYASAITMPTMDFRRDLQIISGLSVVLVVASSVAVGALLAWLVPGLGLAAGIAVGAVVSPTDAVATSIVRSTGLSPRVVTVLEGEAMLNDASALVLLRAAIAATATTVSLWGVAGGFLWAAAGAAAVGWVVGRLNLLVRRHLPRPAAGVAVSVVAPFVASLTAEQLGTSGIVAAVSAGLVTGYGSARYLSAQDRLAEGAVWRTVELVAEGGVFLLMGLQASGLVHEVRALHASPLVALGLGALVATAVVAVRAAFIAPALWSLDRRRRRAASRTERLSDLQRRFEETEPRGRANSAGRTGRLEARRDRFGRMVARRRADLDYLAAQRLGPREGCVLVWAGMRGAVTVAAAQSLPSDAPQRAVLVLVAFVVAAGTLLVQGATLPLLVRGLGLAGAPDDGADRAALRADLVAASTTRLGAPDLTRPDGTPFDPDVLARVRTEVGALQQRLLEPDAHGRTRPQYIDLRRVLIDAQRAELVRQRNLGAYPSTVLDDALAQLDADQLGLDMR